MSEAIVLLVSIGAVILTTVSLGIAGERGMQRMRDRAEQIDAAFASSQRKAERVLSGIRYRNAFDAAENMLSLDVSSSAPGLCPSCLDGTHDKRHK